MEYNKSDKLKIEYYAKMYTFMEIPKLRKQDNSINEKINHCEEIIRTAQLNLHNLVNKYKESVDTRNNMKEQYFKINGYSGDRRLDEFAAEDWCYEETVIMNNHLKNLLKCEGKIKAYTKLIERLQTKKSNR